MCVYDLTSYDIEQRVRTTNAVREREREREREERERERERERAHRRSTERSSGDLRALSPQQSKTEICWKKEIFQRTSRPLLLRRKETRAE